MIWIGPSAQRSTVEWFQLLVTFTRWLPYMGDVCTCMVANEAILNTVRVIIKWDPCDSLQLNYTYYILTGPNNLRPPIDFVNYVCTNV